MTAGLLFWLHAWKLRAAEIEFSPSGPFLLPMFVVPPAVDAFNWFSWTEDAQHDEQIRAATWASGPSTGKGSRLSAPQSSHVRWMKTKPTLALPFHKDTFEGSWRYLHELCQGRSQAWSLLSVLLICSQSHSVTLCWQAEVSLLLIAWLPN
jgi:hypothetical protein